MKKSNVIMLTIGAVGGFLGAKYGKSVVGYVKSCALRKPIEEVANEIHKTMCKNVNDIKKNTEELKNNILETSEHIDFHSISRDEKKSGIYTGVPDSPISPVFFKITPEKPEGNVAKKTIEDVVSEVTKKEDKIIAKDVHLEFPEGKNLDTVSPLEVKVVSENPKNKKKK